MNKLTAYTKRFGKDGFCLLCVSLVISATAQVTVQLQLPPAGLRLKSQLWNLAVVNASPETALVQVEVSLSNAATNERLFSGVSRLLTLQKGILLITPGNAAPVSYTVWAHKSSLTDGMDGTLPLGNYNACYTVVKLLSSTKEKIAEECEIVSVDPLSPPVLMTPLNEETVENKTPLFTWTSPTPAEQFGDLRYNWKLVEVYDKQSPQAALQENLPVWSQRHLKSTALYYNNGFPALDTNKHYAWQIVATSDQLPVASSEVFSFRTKKKSTSSANALPDYYVRLRRNDEEQFSVVGDQLKYVYNNEANDLSVLPRLYRLDASLRKEMTAQPELTLRYGDNFLETDLSPFRLADKSFYLLELTNSKGERWCVKFQYRKSK